ncbi:DUF1415 domain-containing protein [Flaviaesturariibacter amylovorans]|uniref:DUF1415 domain-containing protein n=1 Tax=Flaviaesturariibacter amylovorans TaxID=1084520 RepID=A0ABP8G598_9BACT
MQHPRHAQLIAHTKKWITDVVVGCNFCPFALREVKRDSIRFEIAGGTRAAVLDALTAAFTRLDGDAEIETLFLLVPDGFTRFPEYLKLLDAANLRLQKGGYEGTYQLASFHPGYVFAGSRPDDPANYTNRAPYPMLQVLREESVTRAVDAYPGTEKIPERNIAFAREKGLEYMQRLWMGCRESL